MNLGLGGRVALVSGASQGLGRAIALALAQEEARVALSSRSLARIREAAKDVAGRSGTQTLAHAVDLADAKAAERWVKQVAKHWGRLDVLVINSGGPVEGTAQDAPEKNWRTGFEESLLGGLRLAKLAIPYMKKRGWGRIIFIASTSAKQPIEGVAISNTLRTGILGLSKTLSQELGPFGITVNTVLPGYTATERLTGLARYTAKKKGLSEAAVFEAWTETLPLRRIAEPREIADAVAFLASERAGFITGTALQVDGGRVTSPF